MSEQVEGVRHELALVVAGWVAGLAEVGLAAGCKAHPE